MDDQKVCERCGSIGPTKETPCRICRGGHDLCVQCRDIFEFLYFCEGSQCFLDEPVLRNRDNRGSKQ